MDPIPDASDLSMEMDLDPDNTACPNQVEVMDYRLVADGNGITSTLMRKVTSKPGQTTLPAACLSVWTSWSAGAWAPFVENVINAYQSPTVPVFAYVCDDGTTSCVPEKIHQVAVKLVSADGGSRLANRSGAGGHLADGRQSP